MTSILEEFEISEKIPQNLKIKSFYVFDDSNDKKNIIFITEDDKVFGLGNNEEGVLGFGHNNEVKECTEIKDLLNQKINDLIIGCDFVLGRSEEKQLFGWGSDYFGQLGRGYTRRDKCLKPREIQFFNTEEIKDICCGWRHTLVLSSNDLLYGWGDNMYKQLNSIENVIKRPTNLVINGNKDFKYIYCYYFSSFAITIDGKLFSWGKNECGFLGQGVNEENCIPREIQLSDVHKICSNGSRYYNTYFLTEGFVYFCGNYEENGEQLTQNTPKKINELKGIHDLYDKNICCDSENWFYSLKPNKSEKIEEKYELVFEYFAKRFEITPKMIHFSKDGKIINSFEEKVISDKFISTIDSGAFADGKSTIDKNITFINIIGSGGFGTVNKYWNSLDNQFYAIKMIKIDSLSETNLGEVRTMASIKCHFVVQYYNSWIENNQLFIQMEYCFDNLRNVLKIKPKVFERNSNEAMNSIEFFISCEIFRQITEALNYLHSLKPKPLIHRDLKPENILIGNHENRRICKLADFGLSKFGDNIPDYHTEVGATHGYRAPEINSGKYDTKADVYSLGMIGLEVFDFGDEDLFKLYENSGFLEEMRECEQMVGAKLTASQRSQRLSCDELLKAMKKWFIDTNVIKTEPKLNYYSEKFKENNLLYFNDILKQYLDI